jgi:hypothetical protein
VAAHELRGGKAPKQRQRLLNIHGQVHLLKVPLIKLRQFSYGNYPTMCGRFDLDPERHAW